MKATSVFHLAIKEEIKDIISTETQTVQESKNQYGDDNGNLYFPLSSDEILSDNNAIFRYNGSTTSAYRDCSSRASLTNSLDSQVKTIKYDLSKAFDIMSFLEGVYKIPEIYGILIKSESRSDYLINPLHPLTALAIKLGQIKIPEKGTIIIYEYSAETMSDDRYKNALNPETGYNTNYEKTWLTYISQSKYFINTEVIRRQLNQNLDNYFTELEFLSTLDQINQFAPLQFKENSSSRDKPKTLMVPLQMIVSSMAFPYYGMILLKNPTSSSSVGYNTGIMNSGNIDHKLDRDYNIGDSSGKICTGSYSKEQPVGWLTLNRVYLASMWFEDIVDTNKISWISMATTSKKIACSFYKIRESVESTESTESTE